MSINIDLIIIIVFLSINLFVGLYTGHGIKNIKEYAIGNRNFTTAALAATVVATWISGSRFAISVTESYKHGFWDLASAAGDVIALLTIGWIFGPRMKEFFGKLSVADIMGSLYGNNIRIITSLASIAQSIGMLALQIKVFSTLFNHFLGMDSIYAVVISSFVVIAYSAFGGIKAVTFTDVMQFITFGVFIPMFALFIWQSIGSQELIIDTLQNNPKYNVSKFFTYRHPQFVEYLFLFLYSMVPSFNSTMVQRTLIAKNVKQIRQSFTIAAITALVIDLLGHFIGMVVYTHNPGLDPNNIAMYVIDTYTFTGFKGLAIAGVMAMIMSTADSWLNTGSVIFVNDFCKSIGLKIKRELLVTRIFTILMGIGGVLLALSATNLLKLVLLQANFYRPVVTIPLILAVMGFRSSTRAVLIGMFGGIATVIIWRNWIQPVIGIESVVPAMSANLICFMLAHYLLKEPGGWVGTKNLALLQEMEIKSKYNKQMKQRFFSTFINSIQNFNLVKYCAANTPPGGITYTIYGVFSILSIILATFLLDNTLHQQYFHILSIIEAVGLFLGTAFICNKLWPENIKNKYLGIIWHIAVFTTLAFSSSFLVMVSQFSENSLVIFILNLVMVGLLMRWQIALLMIISGGLLAVMAYHIFIGDIGTGPAGYDLKLKITYLSLLISAVLVALVKPQQEQQELSEQTKIYLSEKIRDREEELKKLLELKNEFINNINHEIRTPISGITSISEILDEDYYKLSEEHKRKAVKTIAENSNRLLSLMNNILDLSNLSSLKANLQIQEINLSNLLHDTIKECCKFNNKSDHLEFIIDIEPALIAECDEYYIKQTLGNLISNAIQYSNDGTIVIALKNKLEETNATHVIEFSITDQGIGIPTNELYEIFEPFTVSSKTRNQAGGRGVGLALCKKIIELHKGKIWASNNEDKGSIFTFILPITHLA
ncbi:sodium:solute symporter family transporter [Rickettsiales endosymbiont of Stachyamoeba lipophora]|uniref:sodium:solute symporter family transporter n=1 Tax=Rickettsiales endosymbiont of Stachyamoeba lipophora TaxID=2486578 RepID=UPI000F64B7EB|nr:ATP-binding protein [Rickettsiales endosymbiont of Stachyamoeba lipophora]AZL16023.1 sodium:solute symporter family protein [Rickettsiales endosymbiont of Stachyamoeba lipophora]